MRKVSSVNPPQHYEGYRYPTSHIYVQKHNDRFIKYLNLVNNACLIIKFMLKANIYAKSSFQQLVAC